MEVHPQDGPHPAWSKRSDKAASVLLPVHALFLQLPELQK